MLQKNVKSLLELLKVCIFAEIVFGVRCTLILDHKGNSVRSDIGNKLAKVTS